MDTSVHYHNTNNLEGATLQIATVKAVRQADEVLKIIQLHKKPMTASDVWFKFGATRCPLTSIRRALSNLKKEEKLLKLEIQKIGIYKQPESFYQLK